MINHPELAELTIAHIDCDAFYAAIEKRDDPTLKDKPVIVDHPGGRGVVATEPRRIRFSGGHERAKTETRNQPVS
jgi:nucleotidyltransferase/DNA polymerase involved in DNA repair